MTSTLALVIALGGTGAWAATSLISGRDVRDNSLTGRDVRDLRSADVADRSLRAKDFRAGDLPVGPTGPRGPAGMGQVTVRAQRASAPPDAPSPAAGPVTTAAFAVCLPGEVAIGGGVTTGLSPDRDAVVTSSAPDRQPTTAAEEGPATGWTGTMRYPVQQGEMPVPPRVWVLCAAQGSR